MVVSGCGTASGMEFAVGDCIRDSVNANGQAEPVDCPTDDSVRIQKLANNGAQPTCERGYYPSPKGFLYSKETIYATDAVSDITYCGGPGWAGSTRRRRNHRAATLRKKSRHRLPMRQPSRAAFR
jgi:hypothetical protein